MRDRFLRRAAAFTAACALAFAGLLPAATADEPVVDPPGGKTVVGETSPIHDPALIIADDGTWYAFSTGLVNRENGGTIQIWTSTDDGTTWASAGNVWDAIPAWIDEHFSDGALPDNLWAPEIYEHDGTYYLYYSASRFGTDNSVTALATNTTLDPNDPDYNWVDQGAVISSPVSGLAGGKIFNAIDAGIVEDDEGNPYMAIGSFWYGIFLVPLEWPSGKPVDNWQASTVHLADRMMAGNPIEAPYITKHGDYYYLFVSFGYCCQAGNSTYQVAVGRSTSVTGPYLDAEGRNLNNGGGTIVLSAHGAVVGPGGQSVFGDYLAFHYYDASNTAIPYFPTLGLQKLTWVDGWPVADQAVELPTITAEPTAVSAAVGSDAAFTATTSGSPRPVLTWQTSSDGTTWVDVADQPTTTPTTLDALGDAATSTLVMPDVAADSNGLLVRAIARNAHGTATSDAAALTVTTVDPGTPSTTPADPTTTAPGLASPAPGATSPGGTGQASPAPGGAHDPGQAAGSGAHSLAATGGSGIHLAVVGGVLVALGGAALAVVALRRRARA